MNRLLDGFDCRKTRSFDEPASARQQTPQDGLTADEHATNQSQPAQTSMHTAWTGELVNSEPEVPCPAEARQLDKADLADALSLTAPTDRQPPAHPAELPKDAPKSQKTVPSASCSLT